MKQTPHNLGDKVLVTMDALDKYSTTLYKGQYKIIKVNNNETVKTQMGALLDMVNI